MDCKSFSKALAALNQGEEWPPSMSAHLNVCPECTMLAQKFSSFFEAVEVEKTLQVSSFTSTRVLAKLESQKDRNDALVLKPAFLLAFVVSFVIGISGAWIGNIQQISTVDTDIVTDYFTESNTVFYIEQSWINLDDYEE